MARINDIKYIQAHIQKEYEQNPHVSLSGMFKRNRMRAPLAGDYIIIRGIIAKVKELGGSFNYTQIVRACSYSRDYKSSNKGEKTEWLTELAQLAK